MAFKGRTVLAFIIISVFASCILTLTIVGSVDSSILAKERNGTDMPGQASAIDLSGDQEDELTKEEIRKLTTTVQLIENKFVTKVDRQSLIDGAINGMLASLHDPFTVYMDPEEAQGFSESVQSSFTGIGAEVTMVDGRVTVISPINDSPAERAGIHAKDVIVSVNGEKLDSLKLNEAVMKIRGPKGTQAKLGIIRAGSADVIQIIVVRDDIDIETVYAEMLEGQIGKIEIRQFAQKTADRFKDELAQLEAKGMKALIIDVRNDPGGYLYGVLEVIEPLIPEGKLMVQLEYRDKKREHKVSAGPGKDYPIVVLTNKGSASSSEILAGALNQSAGSTLIGETTYGKGTVQTTYEKELGDGSNIKMTIAKWLTPNGNWIHEKGIAPDIAVEQPGYYRSAPLSRESVLQKDHTGEDVKNLQLMLDGLGLEPGRTDGYFSEKTEVAVKAFQRLHELPMTGQVDKITADQLEQAIIKEIQKPENDLQLQEAIKYIRNQIQ